MWPHTIWKTYKKGVYKRLSWQISSAVLCNAEHAHFTLLYHEFFLIQYFVFALHQNMLLHKHILEFDIQRNYSVCALTTKMIELIVNGLLWMFNEKFKWFVYMLWLWIWMRIGRLFQYAIFRLLILFMRQLQRIYFSSV